LENDLIAALNVPTLREGAEFELRSGGHAINDKCNMQQNKKN